MHATNSGDIVSFDTVKVKRRGGTTLVLSGVEGNYAGFSVANSIAKNCVCQGQRTFMRRFVKIAWLERIPAKWNHFAEKDTLQIQWLEQILIAKVRRTFAGFARPRAHSAGRHGRRGDQAHRIHAPSSQDRVKPVCAAKEPIAILAQALGSIRRRRSQGAED